MILKIIRKTLIAVVFLCLAGLALGAVTNAVLARWSSMIIWTASLAIGLVATGLVASVGRRSQPTNGLTLKRQMRADFVAAFDRIPVRTLMTVPVEAGSDMMLMTDRANLFRVPIRAMTVFEEDAHREVESEFNLGASASGFLHDEYHLTGSLLLHRPGMFRATPSEDRSTTTITDTAAGDQRPPRGLARLISNKLARHGIMLEMRSSDHEKFLATTGLSRVTEKDAEQLIYLLNHAVTHQTVICKRCPADRNLFEDVVDERADHEHEWLTVEDPDD